MVVWGMIKLSFRQERSSKNGYSYGRLHYHLLTSWLNLLFSVWFLWSPPEKCYQKSTFINSQTMLFFIRMMNDKNQKFFFMWEKGFSHTQFSIYISFLYSATLFIQTRRATISNIKRTEIFMLFYYSMEIAFLLTFERKNYH